MRRSGRALLLVAASAVLSATPASSDPPSGVGVKGLKLILLDRYAASGKAKAVYVAKDATPGAIHHGTASEPPNLGGTVEMFPLGDPANRLVFDLGDQPGGDGGGWLVSKPTVAKYVNRVAAPGQRGAKVVVVKPSKLLKAVGKNLGDGDAATGDGGATDLDLSTITGADTIRVVVTIVNANAPADTHVMCSDFSGLAVQQVAGDTGYKVVSRTSQAPASCDVVPTTTTSTTPSTSSTTTTPTTSTTTTTTSTPPACCGPTRDVLSFTTAPGSGSCGTLLNSSGSTLLTLDCGGLYFGGGQTAVPLPAVIPDLGRSRTRVTSCDSASGAFVVAGMTAAETGSPFDCTTPGCFFGAPLPIPNTLSPPTSTCVVNTVTAAAVGSGNCISGDMAVDLPLNAQIYLTGDLLPLVAGVQPCPLCTGGKCNGGPNDDQPCTPGTTALNAGYPTSHDCPPPPVTDIGGLPIAFDLTSGADAETAQPSGTQLRVFCGYCRDQTALGTGSFESPARACASDADCTNPGFPDCEQRDNGAFSEGAARTITGQGVPGGDLRDGADHPAKLVSIFCIPPTFDATVDAAANLPGPGFAALDGAAKLE